MELVAPMLGPIRTMGGGVEGKSLAVPDAGGEATAWRERLVQLARIESPNPAPGFEVDARIHSRRVEGSVRDLAGIAGAGDVHVHGPARVDAKWVHGMIAAERQPRDHGLRRALGDDRSVQQFVT